MKTSDNLEEIFDLVNKKDKIIGQVTRKEAHRNKNLTHRSVAVAVFNKRGELFLQQRSETKDMDPLFWDISCGGHVVRGDTYKKTAIRELREELWLKKSETKLILISKFLLRAAKETEMVTLYKVYNEGPFRLNKKEIKTGRFFSKNELKETLKSGKIKIGDFARENLKRLRWFF